MGDEKWNAAKQEQDGKRGKTHSNVLYSRTFPQFPKSSLDYYREQKGG